MFITHYLIPVRIIWIFFYLALNPFIHITKEFKYLITEFFFIVTIINHSVLPVHTDLLCSNKTFSKSCCLSLQMVIIFTICIEFQ